MVYDHKEISAASDIDSWIGAWSGLFCFRYCVEAEAGSWGFSRDNFFGIFYGFFSGILCDYGLFSGFNPLPDGSFSLGPAQQKSRAKNPLFYPEPSPPFFCLPFFLSRNCNSDSSPLPKLAILTCWLPCRPSWPPIRAAFLCSFMAWLSRS